MSSSPEPTSFGAFSLSSPSNSGSQILKRSTSVQQLLTKTREEKFVFCAPYLRCREFVDPKDVRTVNPSQDDQENHDCNCEGFKCSNPDQLVSMNQGLLNSHKLSEMEHLEGQIHFKDELCTTCQHKLSCHGNLLQFSPEELDLCTQMCMRIISHEEELTKADSEKKQTHSNLIAKLRMAIQDPISLRMLDASSHDPEIGFPPFERPSIRQILQTFVDHRAISRRLSKTQMSVDHRISETILNGINHYDLGQLADSMSKGQQHILKRWNLFCKSQTGSSDSRFRPSEIFGKALFRMVFKPICDTLEKQWNPDLLSTVPLFLEDLKAELFNNDSPIFQEDSFIKAEKDGPSKRRSDSGTGSKKLKSDSGEAKVTKVGSTGQAPALSTPNHILYSFKPTEMYLKEINEKLGAEEREQKSRDQKARAEERRGIIHFKVIRNDRSVENMIWLTNLKNIFSKQLPKMPVDYIVRLVFDRNHRSLLLLRDNNVIGGITFRPFLDQKFIEIAFCAITSSEQVKGYGTHLMNHLKDAVQPEALTTFLTYADNFAIGYFKKQGFDKKITFPAERWKGRIKDYDGGTLMQCTISMDIPYLKIPEMISNQRKVITDKVAELTSGHVQHTGIDWSKNGTINIMDIPGIRETGLQYTPVSQEQKEKLFRQLESLLESIRQHSSSWPFLKPVNKKEVPDYYEVVKDPIDLEMIEKRLRGGTYYITKEIFLADIKRMCDNCKIYNREETEYHKCALAIETEFYSGASKFFE